MFELLLIIIIVLYVEWKVVMLSKDKQKIYLHVTMLSN